MTDFAHLPKSLIEPLFLCGECDSPDIETQWWVKANGKELVVDADWQVYYCPECGLQHPWRTVKTVERFA